MSVLLDMNQVMISNVMVQIGNHHNIQFDENLVRHMVLNSIRTYRKKFVSEYGELVLCFDDKNYWRKDIFPFYKANRKKNRESSELNWNELFRILNMIRDELKESFPYKALQVDRAEADDIIGTICHTYGKQLNSGDSEKFLILSSDKDYIQLQIYANVTQYDPIRKKWLNHNNPSEYIVEHILKGDSGDGVPNILSPDDCLVLGNRQKPLTKKRQDQIIKELSIDNTIHDEEVLRGYNRNQTMIDLKMIPSEIQDSVLYKYQQEHGDRSKMFGYFVEKRLKNLLTDINDF